MNFQFKIENRHSFEIFLYHLYCMMGNKHTPYVPYQSLSANSSEPYWKW